jgi:hypothetical protein
MDSCPTASRRLTAGIGSRKRRLPCKPKRQVGAACLVPARRWTALADPGSHSERIVGLRLVR